MTTQDLPDAPRASQEQSGFGHLSLIKIRIERYRPITPEAKGLIQGAHIMPLPAIETAEGRVTYWIALEGTNDWSAPTRHLDRAIQLYQDFLQKHLVTTSFSHASI